MSNKIFLIAGEPSGDTLGARLMAALKKQSPGIQFIGVGGPKMEAEGLKSLLPMDELCVIGLWEVIGQLPRLIKLIKGMVEEIEKANPDAVITIDLPDFNFEVLSRVKKRGNSKAKLIHYVAPSVWAWRPKRAIWISTFLDALMCLLPFEPEYFPKIRAEFVGHPLIEENRKGDGIAFRDKQGIPRDAKTLGLFFGSRPSEIKAHGKILKDVASGMWEQFPDMHFIIPTIPSLEYDVRKLVEDLKGPKIIITDPQMKPDAFAACDRAVAVSGTVCLELTLAGVPHLLVYRMHPVTWVLLRRLVKVKYAHLANILLAEEVVPEYLQSKANAFDVGKGLIKLYKIESEAQKQTDKTPALWNILGADGDKTPSGRAADFVLSVISGF